MNPLLPPTNVTKPNFLAADLAYIKYGKPIFLCSSRNKRPLTKNGFYDATLDVDHAKGERSKYPDALTAIPTGYASDFFVLDIDNKKGVNGFETLAALEAKYGPLPDTLTVVTPTGGEHRYFIFPDTEPPLGNTTGKIGLGLDTRGEGGYVAVPPSKIGSKFYRFKNFGTKPAPLPGWIIELLQKPKQESPPPQGPPREMSAVELANGGSPWGLKAYEELRVEMDSTPPGTSNDTWNRISFRLGQLVAGGQLTESTAELLKHSPRLSRKSQDEINKTFLSGFEKGKQFPDYPQERPHMAPSARQSKGNSADHDPPLASQKTPPAGSGARRNLKLVGGTGTDGPAPKPEPEFVPDNVSEDWIAQAVVGYCGKDILFDAVRKTPFFWDGHRWKADRTNRLLDISRQFCRRFNPSGKASLGKHSTAAGVVKLVAADQQVAVVPEIFDKDDLLLGCPGGVIELASGIFRPGRREDHITMSAGTDPASGEDCPLWTAFIGQCTKMDQAYYSFLKRLVGYLLTGLTTLHLFIIIFGPGGGGKSTFLDTIRAMMGTYAKPVDLALFMEGSESERRYALASVFLKRLITAAETKPGQSINTAFIKNITGDRELEARQIYGAPFDFQRKFTPILATNHRPKIPVVDSGLTRRLILLPFNNIPTEADEDLGDKLLTELPGILRWSINGYLEFKVKGLMPPEIVKASTKKYLWDEDTLQQWLDEACIIGSLEFEGVTTLRQSWNDFQKCQGVDPEKVTKAKGFSALMASRGFMSEHKKTGNFFTGLRLRTLADAPRLVKGSEDR